MSPGEIERLSRLDFLEFLEEVLEEVKSLSHRPKMDTTYKNARELGDLIIKRFARELGLNWDDRKNPEYLDIYRSQQILDKYPFNSSDKQKSKLIEEFKDEMGYDLKHALNIRKRNLSQ